MSFYVIDDHPMMREAVAMLLRRQCPGVEVIELDRLGLLSEAIEKHGPPELFSLDLKLPDTTGVSGVISLKERFPLVPLAVLSASPVADWEEQCIEAGADIYIEKSAGATEIGASLRGLLGADSSLEERVGTGTKLSKRQKQLLIMLDKGLSNKTIADELGISEHTVKVHLWRLYRRIQVKSRTQAIFFARANGLLG